MRKGRSGSLDWRTLLARSLAKHRLSLGIQRAQAILLWPEVVGPELARLTRARTLYGGTLVVEARDSVLANFLTLQRAMFLERLNARLGERPLTELRFVVGHITPPREAPAPTPLPAPDARRAAELVSDVAEELRPAALKAAEAVTRARRWREAQGFRPCPSCGEPSRDQPCLACQVSFENPLVRRESGLLIRTPERLAGLEGTLGESGTSAARYLALQGLAEQLEMLALECVREGGAAEYREFLRAQAEAWLSLHHRKPRRELLRADWQALPERPRHVLAAR